MLGTISVALSGPVSEEQLVIEPTTINANRLEFFGNPG